MVHNIQIDIHGVTYKQYLEFSNAFLKGNQREALLKAKQFILQWDFEQPLSDPKAVLKLPFEDGAEVARTLFAKFKELYETAATDDVDVSIKGWSMEKWIEFDDLRLKANVEKYEPMMHQIAKMEGTSVEKPLSLYQGMVMNKAITEKAGRIMQGLN